MEYKIVSIEYEYGTYVFEELERRVNRLIMQGWEPLGGISVYKPYENLYKVRVSQAMIKK